MSAPTQPSFFVDIYNTSYQPNGGGSGSVVNIFAVDSIDFDRAENVTMGFDNVKLRPTGAHVTGIMDSVTISTKDFNGIDILLTSVGPGTLTYSTRAMAHNSTAGSQLADQTHTIINVFWQKKTLQQPTKTCHSYKLSGFVMEASGGDSTDPFSVAVTSSPPSEA